MTSPGIESQVLELGLNTGSKSMTLEHFCWLLDQVLGPKA